MSNISQNIMTTIQILVNDAIKNTKYSKTIEAQIINCENITTGKYRCNYQGVIIDAYSNDPSILYHQNDYVYIIVPQNDMSKKKIIIYGARYSQNQDKIIINAKTGNATFQTANVTNFTATTANVNLLNATNANVDDLYLKNAHRIWGFTTAADAVRMLGISGSNNIVFGETAFNQGEMYFYVNNRTGTNPDTQQPYDDNHRFRFYLDNTSLLDIGKNGINITGNTTVTGTFTATNHITLQTDTYLYNDTYLRGYQNDNSSLSTLIGLNTSNNIQIGGTAFTGNIEFYINNNSYLLAIKSNKLQFNTTVTSHNNIILDNNKYLRGYNKPAQGDTASDYALLGITTGNNIQIGSSGFDAGNMNFVLKNNNNNNQFCFCFNTITNTALTIANNHITINKEMQVSYNTRLKWYDGSSSSANLQTMLALAPDDTQTGTPAAAFVGDAGFAGNLYIRVNSNKKILFKRGNNIVAYIDATGCHNGAPSSY